MSAPYRYEFEDLPCMTCDGTQEIECGRDWQREPCPDCARQSPEDYRASIADAQAKEDRIHGDAA